MLAWARALGEFGATITFAGNFPGTTQTMPLAIYLALETDPQEALVLSLVLIAISFAVLVGLRDRWLGGFARPVTVAHDARGAIGVAPRHARSRRRARVAPRRAARAPRTERRRQDDGAARLAGLLPLDRGRIAIDGVVVDDPARDVFVPPERRPIGVVFQDYLLFAHLTALENVAFGLRARGIDKADARRRALELAGPVGLAEYAGEAARAVGRSGAAGRAGPGARHRSPVAAARRAARRARRRHPREVRRDLRHHLASFDGMRLLVTHDPVDAYALADRVAILDDGRIVQFGTIAEVTAHPRSRYVAELVGINLVAGESPTAC